MAELTNLEKLTLQLGTRTVAFAEGTLALLLSDIEEYLTGRGVDVATHTALVRRIALVRVNQIGSEGVASESFSGSSQNFLDNLPADILTDIRSARTVIW